jgi:zinc transport system substrate-binding protein
MILSFVAAALLAAAASGCGGSATEEPDQTVVAAFYPLAYLAERIAPAAAVRNLTPAGAEPHDIALSPRDVEAVRSSEVVLYVGGDFMPAVEDAAEGSDQAVDLLAGADPLPDDPHAWLDPGRYATMAAVAARALGEEGAEAELGDELAALDMEFRNGLATCKRREIVTSHAAFSYLAEAYDLEQVALAGLSPEAEPSARALEDLIAEVRRSGATTVFTEPLASSRVAETVAREAGAETATLNPLEGLSDDQLAAGHDYFSVMRSNLAALREALECR